jgi:hypothetical protein
MANTTRQGQLTNKVRYPLAVEALENRYVPSTLQVLNGVLTYTAGAGIANALAIAVSGNNYTFTETQEIINAPGLTGNGTHTVTVPENLVSRMNILLGDDNDTVDIGAGTLAGIQAFVKVDGGAGSDTVNLFDQGSTLSNSYVVRDNSIARSGSGVVSYSDVEQVKLNAGAAADSATVLATSASTFVTLNLGGGNDIVNLGTRTGTSLDLITSPVTVNGEAGTDTVFLNDQTDTNANSYVVTAKDVTRNNLEILSYATVEGLTLNAGAFDDTAAAQSTIAATPVTLKMGGGNDVVAVGSAANSLDAILGRVSVDGQLGADRLMVNDRGPSAAPATPSRRTPLRASAARPSPTRASRI